MMLLRPVHEVVPESFEELLMCPKPPSLSPDKTSDVSACLPVGPAEDSGPLREEQETGVVPPSPQRPRHVRLDLGQPLLRVGGRTIPLAQRLGLDWHRPRLEAGIKKGGLDAYNSLALSLGRSGEASEVEYPTVLCRYLTLRKGLPLSVPYVLYIPFRMSGTSATYLEEDKHVKIRRCGLQLPTSLAVANAISKSPTANKPPRKLASLWFEDGVCISECTCHDPGPALP
ncbi:uncharacterized protein BDZ83DRAFT_657704 [Colletotrichum acutatum]|uniref:Uncharacterized protein n=1 Tax=Glomerella acutata TaxID=27357 RepID=A0AAD8U641_GLOAC|nr:uncharacterized protein BDZ83DRAFT_657704 [Colletotrichum acutatum]KAK1707555.1 hypothetical protein BDZ83DRAFT_657704 [Colletotrichum acutatum]